MRSLMLLIAVAAMGCDSPSGDGGQQGDVCVTAGWKCATPACSQFPTNPGCDYVDPMNGRCPIDRPQCFDPSKASGYCDPAFSVCAKAKAAPPPQCPPMLCSRGDVAVCNDVNDALYCVNGYHCQTFGCNPDGGAGDGGGDMTTPMDLATGDF